MDIVPAKTIKHKTPKDRDESTYAYALSATLFNTKQLFVSSELVGPGKRASAPHTHQKIDEIALVVKGELYAHEGEQVSKLEQGDFVYFRAGSAKKHFLENKSDSNAEFLVIRQATTSSDAIYWSLFLQALSSPDQVENITKTPSKDIGYFNKNHSNITRFIKITIKNLLFLIKRLIKTHDLIKRSTFLTA